MKPENANDNSEFEDKQPVDEDGGDLASTDDIDEASTEIEDTTADAETDNDSIDDIQDMDEDDVTGDADGAMSIDEEAAQEAPTDANLPIPDSDLIVTPSSLDELPMDADTDDHDAIDESSADETPAEPAISTPIEPDVPVPDSTQVDMPPTMTDVPPVPPPVAAAAQASPPPISTVNNNEATTMSDQTAVTSNNNFSGGTYDEYVLTPEGNWPPPIFVRKTAQPRERFYLEYRWHSQWQYYDAKATQAKDTYYWYQRIVVIGSLIIPALVSLNSTIARFVSAFLPVTEQGQESTETLVRIGVDSVTVFISLAVAGSAALESLYKYGENWSSYRSAAEELQAEKNFYDMSAGPYENNPTAFATFVTRVEGIIANQNGKYFQAVQSQIAQQTEENAAIVDSYLGGDDDDMDNDLANQPSGAVDIG